MARETGRKGDRDNDDAEQHSNTVTVDVFQLYRGNRREEDRAAAADDVRFEVRHHDRDTLTHAAFNRLYDHVGSEPVNRDNEPDDPDEATSIALGLVWHRWNRGSGRESQTFIDAETRSLEVGDVLALNGDLYLVAPIGWRKVELGTGAGESATQSTEVA